MGKSILQLLFEHWTGKRDYDETLAEAQRILDDCRAGTDNIVRGMDRREVLDEFRRRVAARGLPP